MSSIAHGKHKTCRRFNDPGHAHELTFSCYRHLPLLARNRTRQWFVDALGRARNRYLFDIWAYVIMPEHVHILRFPRQDHYSISRILAAIKWPVAYWALRHVRAHRPEWIERLTDRQPSGRTVMRFWQRGGGYDRNIYQDSALHHAMEYIHNNPVRRGLVDSAGKWWWSSARWYEGPRHGPLLIDEMPALTNVGGGRKHVRL